MAPDLSGDEEYLVKFCGSDTTRRASNPASLLSQDNATRASWTMLFSPGDITGLIHRTGNTIYAHQTNLDDSDVNDKDDKWLY